jgi:glycosyltransferase involved in cell wall biosynthesis
MPLLTLIVPVRDEAESFARLVDEIARFVPPPFVVSVVYDSEDDTTLPVARALAADRPWLTLMRNRGRGVVDALRTGFSAVRSGPVLVVMADLSDDLAVVPRLLELYAQGYKIVCPSRWAPGGGSSAGSRIKRALSALAGRSLHHLAGLPVVDATNNFRLYDAALVAELGIESRGGWEVALELTAKAHRRRIPVAEIPVVGRRRVAGRSRFRLLAWLPGYLRWYGYALASRVRGRA